MTIKKNCYLLLVVSLLFTANCASALTLRGLDVEEEEYLEGYWNERVGDYYVPSISYNFQLTGNGGIGLIAFFASTDTRQKTGTHYYGYPHELFPVTVSNERTGWTARQIGNGLASWQNMLWDFRNRQQISHSRFQSLWTDNPADLVRYFGGDPFINVYLAMNDANPIPDGGFTNREFKFINARPSTGILAVDVNGTFVEGTVVPLPVSVWILGSGLLCLIGIGRRNILV